MARLVAFPWVWERIFRKSRFWSGRRRRGAVLGAAGLWRARRASAKHLGAWRRGAEGAGAAGPLWQRAFWGVFGARFEGFVRALFGLLLGVILGIKNNLFELFGCLFRVVLLCCD